MPDTNEMTPEHKILQKLAMETLAEQKRRRRWGIFFKLLGFVYFAFILFALGDWGETSDKLGEGRRHTAVVQLDGIISSASEASAEKINQALRAAFKDRGTQGVILRINSPGGSPVQAGIINDEIRRLRAEYPAIPLYAVVEEMCASGGYYVAAATDKIYVDKASIVGSIGVLIDGFGFTGTMEKLGVERRLLTAGESKGFLDPFSPQAAQDTEHAQAMLNDIHQQFIDVVRKGRGERLKESPGMFSGLVWTGAKSIELGLADELGNVNYVAREVIKAETIRDYTVQTSLSERFAKQFGASMAEGVMSVAGRLGLR
ncbi:MAG: S49 family peptidase [Zoogloeaceae bacterium]|jgi:protease-4|nr:S49 family peptidase [Zoogloeaceae bacterium]